MNRYWIQFPPYVVDLHICTREGEVVHDYSMDWNDQQQQGVLHSQTFNAIRGDQIVVLSRRGLQHEAAEEVPVQRVHRPGVPETQEAASGPEPPAELRGWGV